MRSNKHKLYITSMLLLMAVLFSSCEKGAGEGGSAKIGGKVIIEDYNFDFTIHRDTYPAQDYDVYIIYGDEPYYGDKVATSYDGYFEFSYLREGSYTIFAYSKDKSFDYNTTSELIAIKREVTISSKKQEVIVDDIVVIK